MRGLHACPFRRDHTRIREHSKKNRGTARLTICHLRKC
jgi:hypothetical protein